MTIGWPEGIFLALTLIGIGMHFAKWGQMKEGSDLRYGGWAWVVGNLTYLSLLWWGGFFA